MPISTRASAAVCPFVVYGWMKLRPVKTLALEVDQVRLRRDWQPGVMKQSIRISGRWRQNSKPRWNTALQRTCELEQKLQEFDLGIRDLHCPAGASFELGQDLPSVWNSPSADTRLKQRIVRILIKEIITDVEESRREIILLIHWAGDHHSELRLKKREANADNVQVCKRWKWFDRWQAALPMS